MSSEDLRLLPIGRVRSTLKRRDLAPKQGFEGAPDARVDIEPAFVRGLEGLEAGQEVDASEGRAA